MRGAIDLVALRGQPFGDVHRGDRAVEQAVLADLARELEASLPLAVRPDATAVARSAAAFSAASGAAFRSVYVGGCRLHRRVPREQVVPPVAGAHFDQVAARAEAFDVFLEQKFHHRP